MSNTEKVIDAYIDDCVLSDSVLEEKNKKYPNGKATRLARQELYSRIVAAVPAENSLGGYIKDAHGCEFFCIKKSDIAAHSEEILKLASLPVRNEYKRIMESSELCKWCGSISFGTPMHIYRSNSGCVGGSCECATCQILKMPVLEKVLRIRKSQGIMAAKKFEFEQL